MFEELKVWIHVAIGVSLVAVSAGIAWKATASYYRGEVLRVQHAQDQAVLAQTDRALEAERQQKAAQDAVEQEHEQHIQDSAVLAGRLAGSLRNLQVARARVGALPGAVVHSDGAAGTSPVAGGDRAVEADRGRLAEAARLFDEARDAAVAACLHDSTELGDILDLAARQQPNEKVTR